MSDVIHKLGTVSAVVGCQWGDEGKGKIIDLISSDFDVIARSCGGANAGHTVQVKGEEHIFHLLPSGSLHSGKCIILGSGMVIHFPTLLEELALIEDVVPDITHNLFISSAAHVVFDFHKAIDAAMEEQRKSTSGSGIGTTLRGIGPAYMDKASRVGVRCSDLLEGHLQETLTSRAKDCEHTYGVVIDVEHEMNEIQSALQKCGSSITDTVTALHKEIEGGNRVLIEGAQGFLLDIDHGTYPFVTSSSTTMSGALQGVGLAPQSLQSCIGVVKAYCTRVGDGAFLTEANLESGNRLRDRGGEYGATTGRPRRCGWLNIVDLKTAILVNGITHLNLTKLDVLDEEESIPVCLGLHNNGTAKYENRAGWTSDTAGVTDFDALPENAKDYIAFIEKEVKVPVSFIGTGKGREHMIVR